MNNPDWSNNDELKRLFSDKQSIPNNQKDINFKMLLQLSTAPYLLDKGNVIMSLAMKHPEETDILYACAAIILAVALEQGIKDRLSYMAYYYAIDNNITIIDTPYEALLKDTFRTRVKQMPKLMTDSKFMLNLYSPHADALNSLITLRNNLLHVYDEPQVFIPTSEEVRITDTHIVTRSPIPKSLWSTVTLEQLRDYQAAVDIYFREILYPETGEIQSGQIVLPSA